MLPQLILELFVLQCPVLQETLLGLCAFSGRVSIVRRELVIVFVGLHRVKSFVLLLTQGLCAALGEVLTDMRGAVILTEAHARALSL